MKAKTKLTKLWSILLVLVMVVGLLPTVALAEEAAPTTPTTTETTSETTTTTTPETTTPAPASTPAPATETRTADFEANPGAALALLNAAKTAGAADSEWDSSTNTLTLNGVNFETTAAIAVNLPDGAKIVLADNTVNTIKGGDSDTLTCYGIFADRSLTISGSGTLNVTGGASTDGSYGIHVFRGSLTISGSGTLNVTGGATTSGQYGSYGISADQNLTISGGTVTANGGTATTDSYGIYSKGKTEISGGTVNATGGTATNDRSYGIYTKKGLSISGTAKVNATGGTATNGNSYGISTYKDVTIESGTVTATGGTASNSKGIFVNSNSVTIKGGQVEATGGKAGDDSYGIDSASVNIGGGTVTAKGGETTNGYSYGISSLYDIKISDGTVTAEGGTATNGRSYGIYANSSYGSISVSGGTVTAKVGAVLTASALSQKPRELPNAYQWRISESGVYTQFSDSASAYTWNAAHTYVEIRYNDPAATTTYTVTVTNGTASVSQAAAGTTVTLNANDAPSGKVFDKWVVESGSASITLANASSANTTFTMPAGNVSVKATYKAAPHTHSYGSVWKSDADKHWHECSCGAKSEEAAHTASDWITDTPATATTAGTKHKECTDCGYVMETGTIPATGSVTAPKIIKGDGAKVTHGEKTALSFHSDADFSDFIRVEIDGNTLDAKNYTVKKGSTIVTLKADYVSTLSVGTHTIGIVSYSGTATATFTVEAKQTTGGEYNPNTGAQDDVPQTGDNSMMALWIAVLFVPAAGVLGTAVFGKKKQNQAE